VTQPGPLAHVAPRLARGRSASRFCRTYASDGRTTLSNASHLIPSKPYRPVSATRVAAQPELEVVERLAAENRPRLASVGGAARGSATLGRRASATSDPPDLPGPPAGSIRGANPRFGVGAKLVQARRVRGRSRPEQPTCKRPDVCSRGRSARSGRGLVYPPWSPGVFAVDDPRNVTGLKGPGSVPHGQSVRVGGKRAPVRRPGAVRDALISERPGQAPHPIQLVFVQTY